MTNPLPAVQKLTLQTSDVDVIRRALRAAICPFTSLDDDVIGPMVRWVSSYSDLASGVALLTAVMTERAYCDSMALVEISAHRTTIVTPTSGTRITLERLMEFRADEGRYVLTVDFGAAGSQSRADQICEYDPAQYDDDGGRVEWPAIPWVVTAVVVTVEPDRSRGQWPPGRH